MSAVETVGGADLPALWELERDFYRESKEVRSLTKWFRPVAEIKPWAQPTIRCWETRNDGAIGYNLC